MQVRIDVARHDGPDPTEGLAEELAEVRAEGRAEGREAEVEQRRRLYKQWREAEEVTQPCVSEAAPLCALGCSPVC